MTLVLESKLENEVRQKAAERGQDADAYLQELIQAALHWRVTSLLQTLSFDAKTSMTMRKAVNFASSD